MALAFAIAFFLTMGGLFLSVGLCNMSDEPDFHKVNRSVQVLFTIGLFAAVVGVAMMFVLGLMWLFPA